MCHVMKILPDMAYVGGTSNNVINIQITLFLLHSSGHFFEFPFFHLALPPSGPNSQTSTLTQLNVYIKRPPHPHSHSQLYIRIYPK